MPHGHIFAATGGGGLNTRHTIFGAGVEAPDRAGTVVSPVVGVGPMRVATHTIQSRRKHARESQTLMKKVWCVPSLSKMSRILA